jgi:hypothetical protein
MQRTLIPYVLLLALIGFFAGTQQAAAQDDGSVSNTATATLTLGVTEVSLIKVSAGVINLQLNRREAGLPVETSKSDSTARLLISSVISTSAARTLSAKISAGSLPASTHLELVAMQPNVNFAGTPGALALPITLDATDKPIVTGIETCYSGTGPSDGYPLKFVYALDTNASNYGSLRATTGTQVIVTFTLTAAL